MYVGSKMVETCSGNCLRSTVK